MVQVFKPQTIHYRGTSIQCKASTAVRVLAGRLAFESSKYDVASDSFKAPLKTNTLDKLGGWLNTVQAGCVCVALSGETTLMQYLVKFHPNCQAVSNTNRKKIKNTVIFLLITVYYIKN